MSGYLLRMGSQLTQTGRFSFCSYRKTTPSSRSADASRYFLDRSATPPCSDARRGVTLDGNLFTAPLARDYILGCNVECEPSRVQYVSASRSQVLHLRP